MHNHTQDISSGFSQDSSPIVEKALQGFPTHLCIELERVIGGGGIVPADLVQHICKELDSDTESLMLRLIPLAAAYAEAPVSGYYVGAVVRGQRQNASGYAALYLGANMEFPQRALCHSLHAEQAAVANAWKNREPGITSIAVSAPPCGHCRQFLYELYGPNSLKVIFPDSAGQSYRETSITELLPGAFGPADLGHKGGMMAVNTAPSPLELELGAIDALILKALEAASYSYAPYTKNYAGCALLMHNGSIFSGSYAENAAHNPGLSPLHAALSNMRMACDPRTTASNLHKIVRCVLVETAADVSQRELVATLLSSIAPNLVPEYYPSRAIDSATDPLDRFE